MAEVLGALIATITAEFLCRGREGREGGERIVTISHGMVP